MRPKTKDDYKQVGRGRGAFLHQIRAERALGKPLPPDARVHHADGSKADDAPLVICQDDAYHFQLHARMRIKAAGGDPWADKICSRCQTVKARTAFGVNRWYFDGLDVYCAPCRRERGRERYARRRATIIAQVGAWQRANADKVNAGSRRRYAERKAQRTDAPARPGDAVAGPVD